MILTDRQIREAVKSGDIVIEPFDESQVQPATYDVRVGIQAATTSTKKIINVKEDGYVTLSPGDFGVVIALEYLKLGPQYVARFGLRSKFARKGLIATTGPQIDPGFSGHLIVGITNLTPRTVTLSFKDDFLSIEFHKLEEPASKTYDGPYQDRSELRPEDIEFITETEGMALSEVLTTLRSLSENVGTLTSEVRTMKWIIPLIVAIGLAAISIIVGLQQ